jgi:hypothetical protein
VQFVPLKGFANFDYRRLDEAFPERKNFKLGPDQLAHDLKADLIRSIPDQHQVIRQLMHQTRIDLILADWTFMGAFPLLIGATDVRPLVISCGACVVSLSSEDVSPFAVPEPDEPDCERNRHDNLQFQAMFQSVQDDMNVALQTCRAKPFVAARVAWSGTGINLATDRPSRDTVRTVLRDSSYGCRARRLQAKFTQYDSLRAVTETVASLLASGDIPSRDAA